jgi:hypothetical protein
MEREPRQLHAATSPSETGVAPVRHFIEEISRDHIAELRESLAL